MHAYLLTWNPKKYPFTERTRLAERTSAGEPQTVRWSTGNRRNIEREDRIFLLRQGQRPKGIVAAGYASGASFEADHWDDEVGGKAWYVKVKFDHILDPSVDDPLAVDFGSGPLANVHWNTQTSGIEIPQDAALLLDELWSDHLGEVARVAAEILLDPDAESYSEGRILFRLHRIRERRPEVIEAAKALAMRRYGCLACRVCGFDFEAAYGQIGQGFIEGHHIRPLGTLTRETKTKVSDIALVCSNCHRMLHRRPNMSVEALKAEMERVRG